MGEINGSCKQREELWQRWIDACSELTEAEEEHVEAARVEEQVSRSLLNDHMKKHRCGVPVSEPIEHESILEMFAKDSGIDDSARDWLLRLL
jgi:hypothetical protein